MCWRVTRSSLQGGFMRIRMFYHTLLSDWNHGNAHFLRGVATELILRGHEVRVYEPQDSWSRRSLLEEKGNGPIEKFYRSYPNLDSVRYGPGFDLEGELRDADVVIVHEWNDRELVARIGAIRKWSGNFTLLFHDTHHRMVTAPQEMSAYDLSDYDGVLAYGEVLSDL